MKKTDVEDDAKPQGAANVRGTGGPARPDERTDAGTTAPDETTHTAAAGNESESPDETNERPERVRELQDKVEKLEDSLLRAKADYQNLQRRTVAQRAEAIRYANAELMKSLLGVTDDFERSLEAASRSENLQAVVDGVRLVYENLVKALRSAGLEPIDALHEPFDPNIHEAIMQKHSAAYPPGTVIEEIARGYRLHDRVLRPAKVIVATEE